MTGARLNNANLVGATLSNANLRHSDLSGADLRYSRLDGAYMIYAKLNGAILVEPEVLQNTQKEFNTYVWLSGAYLRGANLRNADLTNAVISLEQLEDVYSLDGVTMPDGSMYDGRFDKETEQADK